MSETEVEGRIGVLSPTQKRKDNCAEARGSAKGAGGGCRALGFCGAVVPTAGTRGAGGKGGHREEERKEESRR